MKTLKQVKTELKQALSVDGERLSDSEYAKHEKEILFLKDCVAYLESEPSEEFLKKERDRLDKILEMIPKGYPQWKKNTPDSVYGGDDSKALPYYNKMMQKSKHVRHLKNINYLLEGKLELKTV